MEQGECYNLDLKEKYLRSFLPMHVKIPKFPIMKIIIDTTANYSLNFVIYHNSTIS